MLQIRKIREYTPRGSKVSKKFDTPLEPNVMVTNIKELFRTLPDIIDQIPEEERYNVFYTLGHFPEDTKDTKNRKWSWQEVIPFDIDDIEVTDGKVNPKYLQAISEALGIDLKKCVTMFSGNGLQVLIRPKVQITDAKWFKHNQKYYLTLVSKVNDKLFEYGLKGKADESAFAPNRLFRLPLTLNKKPGKPERWTTLLTDHTDPVDYDIQKASGLPDIDENDQITEKQMGYFKIDTSTVLTGCDFLKDMKANTDTITEPQWYAGLSVLARLDDGPNLCHEYSKGHDSYSARETDSKITQALESSGPRTCDNINKLWGKCKECPNYKKVPSPISLKGDTFIATSNTGFHLLTKKGALVPQYEDLRLHYDQDGHYINIAKAHYRWDGGKYNYLQDAWVDNFAQENFRPAADNKKATEFRGLIKRTNLKDENFFQASTNRCLNLKNGILNIDTMEIKPHDPSHGFVHQLNFDYDPIAHAPLFNQFLDGVTCNNPAMKANLLEYMGYCLANDKPIAQKMLVLEGGGRNGKSTFLDIIMTLGGNAVTSIDSSSMNNVFFKQQLDGALFNILEEMPAFVDTRFWEDMKGLITGKPVTVSRKNKDPYTFHCKTKFIMTCNELPKGATPNHGYFRRLLIVPFKARFEGSSDDKMIGTKIIEGEMSGVINMVLEAYHNLRENDWNFTKSIESEHSLEEYTLQTDNVARWCEEHIETGINESVPKSPLWGVGSEDQGLAINEMYPEYRTWVEESGERSVSKEHFVRRIVLWVERKKVAEVYVTTRIRYRLASKKLRGRLLIGVTWCSDADF